MARNSTHIDASPKKVFAVLANPRSYGYWVVGSRKIRKADRDWPKKGTAFDHSVGVGPFSLRDYSYVENVDPGRFLQLRVKARPFGTARVYITLKKDGRGTHVEMVEAPADALSRVVFNPAGHFAVKLRNVVSLNRLRKIAEGEKRISTRRLPKRDRDAPRPSAND